jgi:beta-phosphoglucomutase
MRWKACLFDLDGVIVDTARYHAEAWGIIASELGVILTDADAEAMKGRSRADSLETILMAYAIDLSEERKAELMERKNRLYLERVSKMGRSEILPGVENWLDQLMQNGVRVALGSSSKNAKAILAEIGLEDAFEVIIDGNSVERFKPDPEVFLLGAAGLGVSPSEAIVFEDAASGVTAALRGGFAVIGIGEEINLSGAHAVIPGFSGLKWASLSNLLD